MNLILFGDTELSILQISAIAALFLAVVVYAFLSFTETFRPPRFLRALRKARATSRLRKQLQGDFSGASTVVYWDRYRNLSKAELFEVTGEFRWSYAGQDIRPDGWELRFTKTG